MARVRRVVEEIEAELHKVPKPRFFNIEQGELELKTYEDGARKLDIFFRGIESPDGSVAQVLVDGDVLCELPLKRGCGQHEYNNENGDQVPELRVGQVVEVQYGGKVFLKGTFTPD
jgi:hypothetical protein